MLLFGWVVRQSWAVTHWLVLPAIAHLGQSPLKPGGTVTWWYVTLQIPNWDWSISQFHSHLVKEGSFVWLGMQTCDISSQSVCKKKKNIDIFFSKKTPIYDIYIDNDVKNLLQSILLQFLVQFNAFVVQVVILGN